MREHQLWAPEIQYGLGSACFCGGGRKQRVGPSMVQTDAILAVFDITPPPSRRIITSGLIVTIGHIHAEAGTPTLGIGSAVWGQQPLVLDESGSDSDGANKKLTRFSLLSSTPPRLRTGELSPLG